MPTIDYKLKKGDSEEFPRNKELIKNKLIDLLESLSLSLTPQQKNERDLEQLADKILELYLSFKINSLNTENVSTYDFEELIKERIKYNKLNSLDQIDSLLEDFFKIKKTNFSIMMENLSLLNNFELKSRKLQKGKQKIFEKFKEKYNLIDSIETIYIIECKEVNGSQTLDFHFENSWNIHYLEELLQKMFNLNIKITPKLLENPQGEMIELSPTVFGSWKSKLDRDHQVTITLKTSDLEVLDLGKILLLKALTQKYYTKDSSDYYDRSGQTLYLYQEKIAINFFVYEYSSIDSKINFKIGLTLENMIRLNTIYAYLGDNAENKFYQKYWNQMDWESTLKEIPNEMGVDERRYHLILGNLLKNALNIEINSFIQVQYFKVFDDPFYSSYKDAYPLNQIFIYAIKRGNILKNPFGLSLDLGNIEMMTLDAFNTREIITKLMYNTTYLFERILEFSKNAHLDLNSEELKAHELFWYNGERLINFPNISKYIVEYILNHTKTIIHYSGDYEEAKKTLIKNLGSFAEIRGHIPINIPNIIDPINESERFYWQLSEKFLKAETIDPSSLLSWGQSYLEHAFDTKWELY